ncbi:type III pantothenate kinase, partial [Vibrio sp. FNV 38]|nr:type III pantothenate kinase [Vibrio sp. FNV 38]
MILAIDVGNTNIVLGWIEKGEIREILRIQTLTGETDAEYAIKLLQLLQISGIDPKSFEGAILSSVVPPVTSA